MALTRPGGYIIATTPTVTFLNGKGYWTQNQITRYQSNRTWPQEFSVVLSVPQQSLQSLLYAWTGTALAYNTYTAPTANARQGTAWDRSGRALFLANTSSINGYEFTKAGGVVSQYTTYTFTYVPVQGTLRASPVSDRLWYWSNDIQGRLCSIAYDPVAKNFSGFTQAVYLNNYPSSADKRPSISPDGNFFGCGDTGANTVRLYAINQSTGTSSGSISPPTSITSLATYSYNVAWNPSGSVIGVGLGSGTPRFRLFRWDPNTYYGSEYSYSNYTGASLGTVYKVWWNSAGNVIFFLNPTAPYIQAYQWNDTNGIGSRFADPPAFTWNAGTTADAIISPDDKLIVFNSGGTSGSEIALAWDNTTGFGAITSMPINSANATNVAFGTITN